MSDETEPTTPNPFAFDPSDIQDGKLFGQFESLDQLKDALLAPKPAGAPDPVDAPEADVDLHVEGLSIPEVQTPESTGLSQADLAPLYEEFQTNGKLSDASYEALAAKGLPRALVDGYVEGQMALVESRAQSIYKAVGGKEVVDKARIWAAKNLTPTEKAAYEQTLATGSAEALAMILQGIVTRAGIQQSSIVGKSTPSLSATPYQNWGEMQKAMNDPRYATDATYRDDVLRRAKAAQTAGYI
jgi:hypothetical protein